MNIFMKISYELINHNCYALLTVFVISNVNCLKGNNILCSLEETLSLYSIVNVLINIAQNIPAII